MKKRRLPRYLLGSAIIFLSFLVALAAFIIAKPERIFAVQSSIQMATTLYRVDDEIMSQTPYGRYYSDMYWRHNAELINIFQAHPEQIPEVLRVTLLNMPHMEALLNGEGDAITISKEQVEEIEAMFKFIASVSSDELRTDIEREQQRTPLQEFVGMTMDEAMTHIEDAWDRDFPK
ncbi:MAG: hypothetical protein R3D55_24300 [Chloroflexota bacterium]